MKRPVFGPYRKRPIVDCRFACRGQTIFPCIEKGNNAETTSELCRALVADAQKGSSLHTVSRGDLWNRSVFDGVCDATSDQGLLRVAPVAGRALLFRSSGPDGMVDPTTWHAGCATHSGKEKHILTFFRSLASSAPSQQLTGGRKDVEDECEEGWIGLDCRQCAPGYTGDFCTRAADFEPTISAENSCEVPLEPSSVITRREESQNIAVDALEELRVFDGFLSTSEVAHLSALGKQLVQTKHGTVKGYMSRVELSTVAAAKHDAIYQAVRKRLTHCTRIRGRCLYMLLLAHKMTFWLPCRWSSVSQILQAYDHTRTSVYTLSRKVLMQGLVYRTMTSTRHRCVL
jgi:hypothetical protein